MKATKKLILATISLVAASSLTVGSTFAWFSYRSDVSLGSIDFSVDSGSENLQVAVTEVGGTYSEDDFKYSLTTEAVANAIKKNNFGAPIVYQPLTVTEDSGSNVLPTNLIRLKNRDGSDASVSTYATFDLIFRYTPAKITDAMPSLLLDYGSIITANPEDDDNYTPSVSCEPTEELMEKLKNGDYGKTLSEGDKIKARARDAARVAFLFNYDSTQNNKIWAPSEHYTISTEHTSDVIKGFYLGNLASDYKSMQTGDPAFSAPVYDSRVYAAPAPKADGDNTSYAKITQFPTLSGSTYSELKITVKVWLEGKDGDCLESVQNDRFAFLLKFRTGNPIVSGS